MIRQEVQFDPQADDCEGLSDTKSLTAVKQSQFVLQAELQNRRFHVFQFFFNRDLILDEKLWN